MRPCARIVRSERPPAAVPAFMLALVSSGERRCCAEHTAYWTARRDAWRCQLMSTVTLFTAGADPAPLSGAWS